MANKTLKCLKYCKIEYNGGKENDGVNFLPSIPGERNPKDIDIDENPEIYDRKSETIYKISRLYYLQC